MTQTIKRHLKVGNAPEYDEGRLLIRMHRDDLPKGIKWNRYISLTVKNSTITCKVRNNELTEVPHPRVHQININKSLREVLRIRTNTVYDFYVSKAARWKGPFYVLKHHPSPAARRNTLLKLLGVAAFIIAVIGVALYYSIWHS
jgi:hypothetical protein